MPFFEWNLRRSDVPLHHDIKNALFLPEFILNIAKNRGFDSYPTMMDFTYPKLLSLPSPFALIDIDKSVVRIQKAIANKEKILIFGDKDADGVTSTAIIYRIINRFQGDISFKVPEGDDHYGMSKAAIDQAKTQNITLIITVDCGITAVEECRYATELGIDVIITDHHEPLDTLPTAFALVNPKLNNYPFPYLAGAGVALKLAQALSESYLLDDYNQELVFFDIETTGLDPEQDDIIEIAAVISKNGIIIKEYQCLIQTEKILEPIIIEVTNITQKMLQENGIPIVEALTNFLDFIGDRPIIGHNIIGFDMKFLQIQLQKYFNKQITNTPIDTLPMARVMFKQLKSHKLLTVGEHLGIYVDRTKLHRALNDVILNAEVYRRMSLTRSRPIQQILSELLPLAAIGTVADIMPLINENRNIVRVGTEQENIKLTTTGLITLLRRLKIMDSLNAKAIGWTLGPIINSPGRLGQASLVVELLITNSIHKANELVEQLIQKDQERKELITSLEEEIVRSTNLDDILTKKHVFIMSNNISRGLTGLIATKLTNQFQVPIIIVALSSDEETASGSVRSTGAFDVINFLQNSSHLFSQFGGHKAAGGFVISQENIPEFKDNITKYMTNWTSTNLKNPLEIDIELTDLSSLNIKNINYLQTLFNPIGSKNPFPNFLIKNVTLIEAKYIGKNKEHMTFIFQKDKTPFNVIAWGFSKRWEELKNHTSFDIVGIPEINDWNNTQEVRLQLIDIDGK
ncbi:MAG: single-stranded-DNA-specific exonuclease RecJ [Spirochaetota bacterium]|nr:single-stranded-DNA-specific exonuclease RecJ [Spirochaetota bacterium]